MPIPANVDCVTHLPGHWLNLAARLPDPLPPALDLHEDRPVGRDVLARIYSEECARIELLDGPYGRDATIAIPDRVLDEYSKYRPTPLCRARGLERRLGFGGAIYYKREDLNPGGSHKPNTAIPQAYYAATQGVSELVTDTGAGQWGVALAWASHNFGMDCTVFMTRNSYLAKPYRRHLMELCGARVIASPSGLTEQGHSLLAKDPGHHGSLGIGMGEAMEHLAGRPHARLALGCMSYYAALHQTVIGLELADQLRRAGIEPDALVGCVGGGSNFVGFVAPFVPTDGGRPRAELVAVESANVAVLTQGTYAYEHADSFGLTPRIKMYTLGRSFLPPEIHAGGLRYHGKSPILSLLYHRGVVGAVAVPQEAAFRAGRMFLETEGVLPAPESAHAIAHVIDRVAAAKQVGAEPTIVFCLSGHGYLDLEGYSHHFEKEAHSSRW